MRMRLLRNLYRYEKADYGARSTMPSLLINHVTRFGSRDVESRSSNWDQRSQSYKGGKGSACPFGSLLVEFSIFSFGSCHSNFTGISNQVFGGVAGSPKTSKERDLSYTKTG